MKLLLTLLTFTFLLNTTFSDTKPTIKYIWRTAGKKDLFSNGAKLDPLKPYAYSDSSVIIYISFIKRGETTYLYLNSKEIHESSYYRFVASVKQTEGMIEVEVFGLDESEVTLDVESSASSEIPIKVPEKECKLAIKYKDKKDLYTLSFKDDQFKYSPNEGTISKVEVLKRCRVREGEANVELFKSRH